MAAWVFSCLWSDSILGLDKSVPSIRSMLLHGGEADNVCLLLVVSFERKSVRLYNTGRPALLLKFKKTRTRIWKPVKNF